MHIVVLVFGEASTEYNILLFVGQLLVPLVNIIVFLIVYGIIRFIVVFPFGGVFARDNSFILCTEFKMLVFDNAGEGTSASV